MKLAYTLLAIVSGTSLYVNAAQFSTEYSIDDLGLSKTEFYKRNNKLQLNSYRNDFPQAVLADFKQKMDAVGNKYIKGDKSLYNQFQTCQALMTHIQLALAITDDIITQVTKNSMRSAAGVETLYKALQPVVQSLKKLKGSLFSRFKSAFSKSSVDAEQAFKDIKNILTKRAKEFIDDYNNFLKKEENKFDQKFQKKMIINN
jgi:hypothetical protein